MSHASIPMYSAIPSTRLCYQCTQRPSTASIASEHDNTTHVKSRTHSLARMHAHNRTLRPPVAFARSLSLSLATSLSLSLWHSRTLAERTAVELLALVHVAHAHRSVGKRVLRVALGFRLVCARACGSSYALPGLLVLWFSVWPNGVVLPGTQNTCQLVSTRASSVQHTSETHVCSTASAGLFGVSSEYERQHSRD